MEATRLKLALATTTATLTALITACGQPNTVKVQAFNAQECAGQARPKTFLVKWKEVPQAYKNRAIHPGSLITRFDNIEQDALENTILKKNAQAVELAEHEFRLKAESTVTSCSNTSTTVWAPTDINASDAWNFLGKKGDGAVVAVLDSGVDITHNLLAPQIWTNVHEVPNNQIDDDNNGYIDDYNGYSIVTDDSGNTLRSPNVMDDNGHGTHVSGIIAGQASSQGFTGAAPKAQIMPLKFMDQNGDGTVGDAITLMDYAINNGAKVINASWGGAMCSDLLRQEIQKVTSHGTVFADAAGNGNPPGHGVDISTEGNAEWPAAFQIPGKITVASINRLLSLSTFSNFGPLVDLAAPGEAILSTYPNNGMCVLSGTSMATPYVSAVAALLAAARPTASALTIADAINSSVVTGHYNVRTVGKLNALNAAKYLMAH